MADNLRISTPIPSGNDIGRMTPAKPLDPATINPSVVPPSNTDRQAGQNPSEFSFLLNRNSVFSKFIQQLGKSPELSQSLGKLVFDVFSRAGQIDKNSASGAALRQLAQAMEMEQPDMVRNLLFQSNERTQFTGPLFQMLRQIAAANPDSGFDAQIAPFLKAFNAYTGAGSTTNAIIAQLEHISTQIPNPHSAQLKELIAQLTTERPLDNLNQNLGVLKDKIIPFLSRYISASNDFGRVRSSITLLVHDLSRLNISAREELAEKFTSLLDFCKYDLHFSSQKINEMTGVFLEHLTRTEGREENKLMDSVLRLLTDGGERATSQRSQALHQSAVSSLLMDQSVYMPFHHLFLPLNFHGKFMFAELWIEKEDDPTGSVRFSEENARQIILTFDIKSMGYFEAILYLSGQKISAKLNCPAEFSGDLKKISAAVRTIFSQNGFQPEQIELTAGGPPAATDELLKKVQERRRVIDVSV